MMNQFETSVRLSARSGNPKGRAGGPLSRGQIPAGVKRVDSIMPFSMRPPAFRPSVQPWRGRIPSPAGMSMQKPHTSSCAAESLARQGAATIPYFSWCESIFPETRKLELTWFHKSLFCNILRRSSFRDSFLNVLRVASQILSDPFGFSLGRFAPSWRFDSAEAGGTRYFPGVPWFNLGCLFFIFE